MTPSKRALRGLRAIAALAQADVQCAEPADEVIAGATRAELAAGFAWLETAIADGEAVRQLDDKLDGLLAARTLVIKTR